MRRHKTRCVSRSDTCYHRDQRSDDIDETYTLQRRSAVGSDQGDNNQPQTKQIKQSKERGDHTPSSIATKCQPEPPLDRETHRDPGDSRTFRGSTTLQRSRHHVHHHHMCATHRYMVVAHCAIHESGLATNGEGKPTPLHTIQSTKRNDRWNTIKIPIREASARAAIIDKRVNNEKQSLPNNASRPVTAT